MASTQERKNMSTLKCFWYSPQILSDLLFIFHLIGEKKLVEGTGYNDLNHTRAASTT